MNVAQETLGFRRAGLSPALSLLMSAFALRIPPAHLPARLRRLTECSPTATGVRSQMTEVSTLEPAFEEFFDGSRARACRLAGIPRGPQMT